MRELGEGDSVSGMRHELFQMKMDGCADVRGGGSELRRQQDNKINDSKLFLNFFLLHASQQ